MMCVMMYGKDQRVWLVIHSRQNLFLDGRRRGRQAGSEDVMLDGLCQV